MTNLKIRVLGCGSSSGTPVPGCSCEVCKSHNQKNKRSRSSIQIIAYNHSILIDSGPDLRQQMLDGNLSSFDSVLFTHTHMDHIAGVNDLLIALRNLGKNINIYGNVETIERIKLIYGYMILDFSTKSSEVLHRIPLLNACPINDYSIINLNEFKIESFKQQHGNEISLGFKIGKFAYSTDLNSLPPASIEILKNNIDIWIVSLMNYDATDKHLGIKKLIDFYHIVQPKKIYLTHMSHRIEYSAINLQFTKLGLPIEASYDGMELEV